ncbi:MAG TPA: N-acetyl-gamma-glutamyl-phosphate reductase [Porphyromonadaceae bacterium]|nr:N-acetyl-gamma-glutamyl-phosphate reductase [Porphyromonadaceae bacterium]
MLFNIRSKKKVRVGIIGGAGYTAGELLRLLIFHPEVEVVFVHSTSSAGKPITSVHEGLYGSTELTFTNELALEKIDVLFFCSPHGETRNFIELKGEPKSCKIIDLSMDFRHKAEGNHFIYGLPELNKKEIQKARCVANPGCFATCIQLALLPLAKNNLLKNDIHIHAITGSTGAGQKPSATSHFSWRNDNISIYKPFEHQHLQEIRESLCQLQPNFDVETNFIPVRGNFSRGIFASLYTDCIISLEEVQKLYATFYKEQPFTFLYKENLDLKQVVNTNKCLLHLEKHGTKLLITSVIDNLLKGASGQAVQNMNLMFGLEETCGLNLKPSAF